MTPRPHRSVGAARRDNIVLARLITSPNGRTITELVEVLADDCAWATRDNVYASVMRLLGRGLVVRQPTPAGFLFTAVAPDPDDPLEALFAAPAADEAEPAALAGDRAHKTRRDRYTHDEIIAAILRWHDEFGEVPRQADWNPALLRHYAKQLASRAVGHLQRIAVYDAGDWPSEQTVRKYFGSWNAAIAAAGFTDHLRSPGEKATTRDHDRTIVPNTGAADGLERLMEVICDAHHGGAPDRLRVALLDLSLEAREWAMRLERQREREQRGGVE